MAFPREVTKTVDRGRHIRMNDFLTMVISHECTQCKCHSALSIATDSVPPCATCSCRVTFDAPIPPTYSPWQQDNHAQPPTRLHNNNFRDRHEDFDRNNRGNGFRPNTRGGKKNKGFRQDLPHMNDRRRSRSRERNRAREFVDTRRRSRSPIRRTKSPVAARPLSRSRSRTRSKTPDRFSRTQDRVATPRSPSPLPIQKEASPPRVLMIPAILDLGDPNVMYDPRDATLPTDMWTATKPTLPETPSFQELKQQLSPPPPPPPVLIEQAPQGPIMACGDDDDDDYYEPFTAEEDTVIPKDMFT
jgi:hypothetical protein